MRELQAENEAQLNASSMEPESHQEAHTLGIVTIANLEPESQPNDVCITFLPTLKYANLVPACRLINLFSATLPIQRRDLTVKTRPPIYLKMNLKPTVTECRLHRKT